MTYKEDWWLRDAEVVADEFPYTFWRPSDDALQRLQTGDMVRLNFAIESNDPEAPGGERMWVQIVDVHPHLFTGTLANNPYFLKTIKFGDVIKFKACHIIDHQLEDASREQFETYFLRCFVTNRVLEGEKYRYVYKEPPDTEDDSGWRILVGNETDEEMEDPSKLSYVALGAVLNKDDSLMSILYEDDGEWAWDDASDSWMPVE